MDIIALNRALCEEYHKTLDAQVFRKYVMSELLAPIEDVGNAIELIRSRYSTMLDCDLLIIGAYLLTQFYSSENEMLSILNLECNFLPQNLQAIVFYLNALQIEKTDKKYTHSQQYREHLLRSCKLCDQYVYPYYKLAEISSSSERTLLYERAKKNIEHSYTVNEIQKLSIEHFLEPSQYIKEFILGTTECLTE